MPIPPGEFIVGRDEKAYVHVIDGSVSRRHAKLLSLEEGLFVEDSGSSNGTAVRGVLISSREPITFGDIVHIGSVPFRVDPEVGGEKITASGSVAGLRPVNQAYVTRDTDRIPFASMEQAVRVSESKQSPAAFVDESGAGKRGAPEASIAREDASSAKPTPLQKGESVHALLAGTRSISRPSPSPSVPTRVPTIAKVQAQPASPAAEQKPRGAIFLAGLAIGMVIGFILGHLF